MRLTLLHTKDGFTMKNPAFVLCPALFALAACSSGTGGTMMPAPQRASHGKVTVTFRVPVVSTTTLSSQRRPQYFSPATTTLAIALKSVNGIPVDYGTQGNIFDLSKICSQSGAYFYCSTTVTVVSGDDILGVLAYSTKPLGALSGNIPLSFAEGEVAIGSGSSAEPAGAEDTTGRLFVTLLPVIYGGQVEASTNVQSDSVPIILSEFVDPAKDVIPASAYQGPPDFANTPHLIDSDTSGLTYLMDASTGQSGRDIAITTPADQVEFINSGNEASSQKISATVAYQAPPADPDATFTIPAYFQIQGSVVAQYTIPPSGSSSDLTFGCTSAGCSKGN
jgi:hypothetical protein